MTVPYWIQDAIFYQIFPDRFANGNPANDPPNVQPWGSPPTIWDFQGGDLRGILHHLDYLLDLGITAIYLNPIFESASNHRYNTRDYYRIDPKLGTMEDFRALLDAAHRNGMRIILDGVFNHCGRGFFAFDDILENGEHSPYKNWFHIKRFPPNAYGEGQAEDYEAWWQFKSLPKFNTDNPDTRRYLLDVARYWIEIGADGWRLDVPNEIDDDSFWAEFRHIVKSLNPDAYLLGEIWTPDPRWADENHFDGLMNYPLREELLRLLQAETLDTVQFAEKIETLLALYPRENVHAMYLPLGTHDTERLWTKLGGNAEKVKLAFLLQMSLPGAPAIYYGDEIGMEGGKDPDCRRAFPWNPEAWKADLRPWVQTLIALRKKHLALRRGDYTRLLAENGERGIYAFARTFGTQTLLVAVNASPSTQTLRIPISEQNAPRVSLINARRYQIQNGYLELALPPWSGDWIGETP